MTRSEEGNGNQLQWELFLTLHSESQRGDGCHWTDCTVPPFNFEVGLRLCWPSKVQQWVTTQDVLHSNSFFFSLLLLFLRTRNGYIIFLGHFSPLVGRDTHYLALNIHTDGALILSSDFSECLALTYEENKDRSRDTLQSLTLLINCQTRNTQYRLYLALMCHQIFRYILALLYTYYIKNRVHIRRFSLSSWEKTVPSYNIH